MKSLPKIVDLRKLFVLLRKEIDDDMVDEGDDEPSIYVTIGWNDKTGNWSFQTGDNSYTGSAYFYPHWACVHIYRTGNLTDLAKSVREELASLTDWR